MNPERDSKTVRVACLLGGLSGVALAAAGCGNWFTSPVTPTPAITVSISKLANKPQLFLNQEVSVSGKLVLAQANYINVLEGRDSYGNETVLDTYASQVIDPSFPVNTIYAYGEKRGELVSYTYSLSDPNFRFITAVQFGPRSTLCPQTTNDVVKVEGTWQLGPNSNYYLNIKPKEK